MYPQEFYSEDYFLPKKGVATPHEYLVECYHDNLSPFKMHDCLLSSWYEDNQLEGHCTLHYADLGLSWQIAFQLCDNVSYSKFVIN